ncbi:hypothetical protein BH11BAC4_BH11BAC4_10300 [soil metagenome]
MTMEATIAEKFHSLLNYLLYTKVEFEIVADEVGDSRLRTALYGFSEESDIYITELCAHLQSLGFEYQYQHILPVISAPIELSSSFTANEKGNELQSICAASEKSITATYYDILNSYFPFPVIREIMTYQLNTLRSILDKICFLNSARFSN